MTKVKRASSVVDRIIENLFYDPADGSMTAFRLQAGDEPYDLVQPLMEQLRQDRLPPYHPAHDHHVQSEGGVIGRYPPQQRLDEQSTIDRQREIARAKELLRRRKNREELNNYEEKLVYDRLDQDEIERRIFYFKRQLEQALSQDKVQLEKLRNIYDSVTYEHKRQIKESIDRLEDRQFALKRVLWTTPQGLEKFLDALFLGKKQLEEMQDFSTWVMGLVGQQIYANVLQKSINASSESTGNAQSRISITDVKRVLTVKKL